MQKVVSDDETDSIYDYKLSDEIEDSIEINNDSADGIKITNFLNSQKVANSFNLEKTSLDGTDKIASFLLYSFPAFCR